MKSAYLPFCCSIRLFGQLGGTANCDAIAANHSAEEITEWLHHNMQYEKELGMCACMVSTNDEQTVANGVLKDMGFSHTPWMVSHIHGTKVRMWWKALQDD